MRRGPEVRLRVFQVSILEGEVAATEEDKIAELKAEVAQLRKTISDQAAALAAHADRERADRERKESRRRVNRQNYERRKGKDSIQTSESDSIQTLNTPSPPLDGSPLPSVPSLPSPLSSPHPISPVPAKAEPESVKPERTLLTLAPSEPDRPEPKKPKAQKPKPPSEPRGDSRHKPLTDALVAADAEVTGKPYGHRGGRDAKAVSECLALADQDGATSGDRAPAEVLRRWRIARRWRGFPACNSLSDLVANWNAYAREQGATAPTNLRAPVRAETQPQYDPSKPSCVTLTGRDAI